MGGSKEISITVYHGNTVYGDKNNCTNSNNNTNGDNSGMSIFDTNPELINDYTEEYDAAMIEKYKNSSSYKETMENNPDEITIYPDNACARWTKKKGSYDITGVDLLNPYEYKLTPDEQENVIRQMINEKKLSEYLDEETGFMKESFGRNYTVYIKKYKEIFGENATLGNLKEILGLRDGLLRTVNPEIGFKDRGTGRDYDTANIDDVTDGRTLIIPKSAVFMAD